MWTDNLSNKQLAEWKKTLSLYKKAAVSIIKTIDLYNRQQQEQPIEHIKYRIKSDESIEGKLLKKNVTPSIENALTLKDLAGIRLVCVFENDIYKIVEKIKDIDYLTVTNEKDYVKTPKKSGYRGYHLIVDVSYKDKIIPVEIQIRSLAMDFWACIEHKLIYKPDDRTKKKVRKSLQKASNQVSQIEKQMVNTENKNQH